MGFKEKRWAGITAVLLWASLAGAQSDNAGITVMVLDSAKVPSAVLQKAENEAGRIFRSSDVPIHWVNCLKKGETKSCHQAPGPNEFMLHIVPDGRTQSDLVFGEAFIGEDGTGKYADVFFNRVREAAETPELNSAQLLGAVAAHELGHLLLGSRSHSAAGIMEPVWKQDALRRIWMGSLLFTAKQAQSIQRRIDTASPSEIAVSGPYHREPGRR